jgi:hypothetical protein
MADIFVSYTRADQELVRLIVALLKGQGKWSRTKYVQWFSGGNPHNEEGPAP